MTTAASTLELGPCAGIAGANGSPLDSELELGLDARLPDSAAHKDPESPLHASTRAYEEAFVAHLDTIDSIIAFIARRHALNAEDIAEFTSMVRLKFVEDGYAVFRKFEGRSSLKTYLAVVIQRLFLDYRVRQWGRWRPSASARREGQAAILLERLTLCQGLSLEQTFTVLTTEYHIDITMADLESLYARLPVRSRRHFVGESALHGMRARDGDADSSITASEHASAASAVMGALAAELAALPAEDRLIVKLRFHDGRSLADIARALSHDPKHLYRRMTRLLGDLRQRLQARGVARPDALAGIGRPELDDEALLRATAISPGESEGFSVQVCRRGHCR